MALNLCASLPTYSGNYYGDGTTTDASSGYGFSGYSGSKDLRLYDYTSKEKIMKRACGQDFELLNEYFNQNKSYVALDEYEDLKNTVKTKLAGYNYTDDDIESILNEAYEQKTGQSFAKTMVENTNNSFACGLWQGIPLFGLSCDSNSTAEALANLSGRTVSKVDVALEYAGGIASGAACGAAIGTIIPIPAIGTLTGAVIGGIWGAAQVLLKNNCTNL